MTDINPPNNPGDLPNSEKDTITEEVRDTIIETEDEVESLVETTTEDSETLSSEESRKRKDEVYSTILSTNANVDDIPDTSAKVEIKYNPYTEWIRRNLQKSSTREEMDLFHCLLSL